MSPATHKVGIVVDPGFGTRVVELARRFHVWVLDSGDNARAIQEVWRSKPADSQGAPLASGITSFTAQSEESPEAACTRIAGDVDEHHGEFGHEPPWSEIEVFGVELSPTLRQAFEGIGATTFTPTLEGFICKR